MLRLSGRTQRTSHCCSVHSNSLSHNTGIQNLRSAWVQLPHLTDTETEGQKANCRPKVTVSGPKGQKNRSGVVKKVSDFFGQMSHWVSLQLMPRPGPGKQQGLCGHQETRHCPECSEVTHCWSDLLAVSLCEIYLMPLFSIFSYKR